MKNLESLNQNENLIAPSDTTFENTTEALDEDLQLNEARKIIEEGLDTKQIKKLNPELAKMILDKMGPESNYLDLSGLLDLDVETAKVFGNYDLNSVILCLVLDGLKGITSDVARELSHYKGPLKLDGLEKIDQYVAQELGNHKGDLLLNGLKEMNFEIASLLSHHEGDLYLNGLTRLDADVASIFENHGGYDFDGKILSSDGDVISVMNSLNGDYGFDDVFPGYMRDQMLSGGNIYLNGITEISLETAEALANYKCGYLSLDGLKTLTPDVARVLAHFDGCLSLNGLENITPEIATGLSEHNGWIVLKGLNNIDASTIKAFSNSECKLCLNGINTLNIESEIALAKHKGEVSLSGLNYIDLPALAKQLVDNTEGTLYLTGLKRIDGEIAAELVKFKGVLYLPSLSEIDDETAEAILQNKSESLMLLIQDSVLKKLGEVEEKMDKGEYLNEGLSTLQEKIHETGEKIDWKGKRGKIEYNWKTNKINSRGKETEVEKIEEDSMRLKGLDLDLTLQEGMWLANLKNRAKHMNKEVTFERSIISKSASFKKTLHIGGKIMLTRKTLNENISACETDEKVEKICEWLNE